MELIIEPKHIPTFIHIPKNAGTYVLSWFQMLNRVFCLKTEKNNIKGWTSERVRRHLVQLPNNKQLTCCIHTPTDIHLNSDAVIRDKKDTHCDSVALDDFLNLITSGNIEVFSISADPIGTGMSDNFKAIDSICATSNKSPCYFTILREPLSRAKSMFEYIKSDESSHEPTHKMYGEQNFHQFVCSLNLEDSWLIRHILNLSDNELLHESHYRQCCQILDRIKIYDIQQSPKAVDEIMGICYGLQKSDVEKRALSIDENKSSYSYNFKFSDLSIKEQETFLTRTYFDRKLYEKYVMREKFPGFKCFEN